MSLRSVLNLTGDHLYDLPLAIVYVTERCNSRCVSCDFWRHGETELSVERARQLATELRALGTRAVLLTGGEVLVHPRWDEITETFREAGMRTWLRISPSSIDVVIMSTKKSDADTVRVPFVPVISNSASSATIVAGQSAAGSENDS